MFNTAIRNIIDLLRLKKDARKTDLEIEMLEREREKAESRIQPASFEDVKKFDPNVRRLINLTPTRVMRKRSRFNKRTLIFIFALTLIALVLITLIYKHLA